MAESREHEAVANARHRLSLQKQAVGERHPEYATSLNQLALLLIMHGNPDGAEPLLRQALEIRKELLGESHPDYATNLSSLAGLLWARGDLDGAEPLLRRALEIRWDVLGSGHPKSIASLNSLEQLLRAKQDWAGVERLAVQDLSSRSPASAPDFRSPTTPTPVAAPPEPSVPSPVAVSTPAPPVETPVSAPAAVPVPPPPRVAEASPVAVASVVTESPAVSQPSKAIPSLAAETHPASQPPTATRESAGGSTRVELVEAHERLAAEFSRVGDRLGREAEQWKAGGAPPTQGLIDDLAVCGREFESLRERVLHLAEALGTEPASTQLSSLEAIAGLLTKLGEAEGRRDQLEALRGQALGVLDRVLALTSSDGKPLPPLEDCRKQAEQQRTAIAEASSLELPVAATRLAEGDHPFNSLLTLVEGEGLSDDLWATSLEIVEAEFGKPMSVAVARSKIVSPAAG